MTPAYYADLYRRYQTYVRTYDSNAPIFRICGGANADDYKWTEVVLRECFAEPAPKEDFTKRFEDYEERLAALERRLQQKEETTKEPNTKKEAKEKWQF